jgi:hypothetical protein
MPEGLPYEQSYASLLQSSLDDTSQTIRIINAGVTGYGPNESLAQIDELVTSLEIDFVVYQFFVNEFEEINIEPATRLQDIGLAQQPQNLRTRYIGRSQMLARLNQAKELLLEAATGRSPVWKYDASFIQLYAAARRDVYTDDLIGRVESTLRKIADAAGNELIILYTPSAIEVAEPTSFRYFPSDRDGSLKDSLDMNLPFRKLSEIADRLELEVLDPRATLRDTELAYHRDSWHWTRAGHAAIAEYLSERLGDIVNEQ